MGGSRCAVTRKFIQYCAFFRALCSAGDVSVHRRRRFDAERRVEIALLWVVYSTSAAHSARNCSREQGVNVVVAFVLSGLMVTFCRNVSSGQSVNVSGCGIIAISVTGDIAT
jgi:hypothetical protein